MDPVFYLFKNDEKYVKTFQELTRYHLSVLDELSTLYDIKLPFY